MAKRYRPDPDAALWARVTATVAPLAGRTTGPPLETTPPTAKGRTVPAARIATPVPKPPKRSGNTLDGSWDRRLARGAAIPDRSVDLHGQTLARAHALIDAALAEASRQDERVILLVTGKARPDARGGRGAIRALIHDWLAHSRHAAAIAAVRPAHPRHGGAGALYVILRRR